MLLLCNILVYPNNFEKIGNFLDQEAMTDTNKNISVKTKFVSLNNYNII